MKKTRIALPISFANHFLVQVSCGFRTGKRVLKQFAKFQDKTKTTRQKTVYETRYHIRVYMQPSFLTSTKFIV